MFLLVCYLVAIPTCQTIAAPAVPHKNCFGISSLDYVEYVFVYSVGISHESNSLFQLFSTEEQNLEKYSNHIR